MSQKDFVVIAEVIKSRLDREAGNTTKQAEIRREAARDMAYAFCARLSRDNARFKAPVFLRACGF